MNELNLRHERVHPGRTPERVRYLTAEELLLSDIPSDTDRLPLQELVVEGALSFGEKTQFEFGHLNILVGPNGSGKSNLINCIRVLRYAPQTIQQTFQQTGVEDWLYKGGKKAAKATLSATSYVPGISTPILHQLVLSPPVGVRVPLEESISQKGGDNDSQLPYFAGSHRNPSGTRLTTSGDGKRRRIRSLGSDEYNYFESILSQIRDVGQYPEISRLARLYGEFRVYSEWSFGRTSKLREPSPTNREPGFLAESMDDLALTLNGLENTAAHQAIRRLLKDLKESYTDYITRVQPNRVSLELKEYPFEATIPAFLLSDGTLRFLALAAILLHPHPSPLICLEEPELGMHPDMIRIVAGMIIEASTKTQLIIATHSEHLLTALQDDFDALFAFDSGPDGSSVNRLTREEYLEWRVEHDLGELWSSGELGGVRY